MDDCHPVVLQCRVPLFGCLVGIMMRNPYEHDDFTPLTCILCEEDITPRDACRRYLGGLAHDGCIDKQQDAQQYLEADRRADEEDDEC